MFQPLSNLPVGDDDCNIVPLDPAPDSLKIFQQKFHLLLESLQLSLDDDMRDLLISLCFDSPLVPNCSDSKHIGLKTEDYSNRDKMPCSIKNHGQNCIICSELRVANKQLCFLIVGETACGKECAFKHYFIFFKGKSHILQALNILMSKHESVLELNGRNSSGVGLTVSVVQPTVKSQGKSKNTYRWKFNFVGNIPNFSLQPWCNVECQYSTS